MRKKSPLRKKTKRGRKKDAVDFLDLIDSDADGLSDEEEKKLGTDLFNPDTDNDGLSDLAEVKVYHTDPLNPDTDGDSIPDGEEVKMGLNPLHFDKLKDLLIPHEGNGHRPHLLHTKRAVAYSALFLLLKGMVITAVAIMPIQAFLAPDILAEQQDKLIMLVDNLRQEQGMENLFTEKKLAQSADAKSTDMLEQSYFAHVGPDGHDLSYWVRSVNYDFKVAGENLAMGFSDADSVMQAWINSPLHYKNLVDPDFIDMGIGLASGDYEGQSTVFIAQHFGAPRVKIAGVNIAQAAEENNPPAPEKKEDLVALINNQAGEIMAEEETVEKELFYNKENSKVYWRYDGQETTLTVEAFIEGNVDKATVVIQDYNILLQPDSNQSNLYTGQLTVPDLADDFFKVVISPTIIINNSWGGEIMDSISWYQVKVVSPTPWEKYSTAKKILPDFIANLLSFSNAIFILALVIITLVLSLSIFIKIKKQDPHIIVQTLSVMLLLIVIIIA